MGRPRKRPVGARFLLREVREARLMTQADLAGKAGVDIDTISTIENGKRLPRRHTLEKLAKALEVEIDVLVEPPERRKAA